MHNEPNTYLGQEALAETQFLIGSSVDKAERPSHGSRCGHQHDRGGDFDVSIFSKLCRKTRARVVIYSTVRDGCRKDINGLASS